MPDLRVKLGPLTLPNPVLVAAGTFGYGLEFIGALRLERLGGLITKTLTLKAREGNPPPRLVETSSGMLNAVGLQNVGLEVFLREKLPSLRRHDVPVIVSVLGETPQELAQTVRVLDQAEGVDGIELNLSCPNLKRSAECGVRNAECGMRSAESDHSKFRIPNSEFHTQMVAQDPEATALYVQSARSCTNKLLIAKLSPDMTDIRSVAQAAENAGANCLSVGNTFVGMSLDPETRESRLGSMTGGLSGPAIRPLMVYRVWYTAQTARIPIIGTGGIVRAEDALEYILAGATAVAVGTASFARPDAAVCVLRGIERFLRKHRMDSLEAIRGVIHS